MMEDYVEVFRHIQPFEVEKVLAVLQNEGISCYIEAAGAWGKAPVHNPDEYHSLPTTSYYVLVQKDRFKDSQEIVSKLLRGEIQPPKKSFKKPIIKIERVHKIGAALVVLLFFVLLFLTIWYASSK